MTSRITDALYTGQAHSRGRKVPMLDTQYGGAMGAWHWNQGEWVSTTHYVRRNLVCLLLEAPKGFQMMPDPQFWVSCLKSMVEVHAKTIEGLNAGLTVEVAETQVSGGGEVFEDFTNVTRARTQPTFTFTDLYGRPIQNFLHDWITYLIGDPDSKVPMLSTIEGIRPNDLLADIYSATMLFYEPDPTHTKVAKAWLVTNMYPKSTGEIIGKRDLASAGETLELNIEFTGVSQTGLGIVNFAQQLMDNINIANANPNLRNAFLTGPESDVLANPAQAYKGVAEKLGANTVQRS